MKDIAPAPRLTGKVSFDDLFPGFNVDAFMRACISGQVSFTNAKSTIRGVPKGSRPNDRIEPGQYQKGT